MVPPWEKYPELEQGDLGWRMGYGQGYLDTFLEWWEPLPLADKRAYAEHHPPRADWAGFFSDSESF